MTNSDQAPHLINFDEIKETARKGVRRAAFFMGFGLNAANNPDCTRHTLGEEIPEIKESIIKYHLMPRLEGAALDDAKRAFATWIVGCALREVIESFGLFLDRIHNACLTMHIATGTSLPGEPDKLQNDFHGYGGIEKKLKTLDSRFSTRPHHPEYLFSISNARHCLTHRNGVVITRDLKDGDTFCVRWTSLEIVAQTPDGEVSLMQNHGPIHFPEGATVKMRHVSREAQFKLGELVRFNPQQLHEMCLFIMLSADQVVASALQHAQDLGIPVSTETSTR